MTAGMSNHHRQQTHHQRDNRNHLPSPRLNGNSHYRRLYRPAHTSLLTFPCLQNIPMIAAFALYLVPSRHPARSVAIGSPYPLATSTYIEPTTRMKGTA